LRPRAAIDCVRRLLGEETGADSLPKCRGTVDRLTIALTQVTYGHADQRDRWGFQFGQHWASTNVATPTWDYAIDYCFRSWPGGYDSTSANNVRYGMSQWNEEFLRGTALQKLDFRYTARTSCTTSTHLFVELAVLDPSAGGVFTEQPDSVAHVVRATLFIASRSDIFYGGCCPVWQGEDDDRYHVQHIASHESGHGHGYIPPGYHSQSSASVMCRSLDPGTVIRPGENIYDREMMDDQYPNK
jgi:hypothetical protein